MRSYVSGGLNWASSAINPENGVMLKGDVSNTAGMLAISGSANSPLGIGLQPAAQINILPVPTRMTRGAIVEANSLDEREKLVKSIVAGIAVASPITSLPEKIGDRVMIKGRKALILGVDSEGKGFDYIFIDSYRSGLQEEKGEWSDIQEVIPPRYALEFPFNPGDKVEVKYEGVWQKGTIVQAAGGTYEIVTYTKVHNNMDYFGGRGLTTSYFSDTEKAFSYGLRKAKKEMAAGVGETAIVENPTEEVSAPPVITSLSVKTWNQDIGKILLDIIRHFAKTEKEAADTKETEAIREFRSILEQAIAASDESFKSLLVQALRQLLNHPELIRKMTLVNMLGQIQAYPGFTDIFHIAANEIHYTDALIQYDMYETVTGLAKPNLSKAQSSKEKIQLIEFLEPESYRNSPIDQARWFKSSETARSRMSEVINLMNSPLLDAHWKHSKTGIETSYVRAALILRLFFYIQKAIEEGSIVPGLLKGSPLLLEDGAQPPVNSSPINANSVVTTSKKTGGIDWRELSMTVQPMGSFRGLDFGLPRLSRAEIEGIDVESQIGQIKNMVSSGISPSGRRVKELVAACAQKGQISAYADDLLACIGDILKLEEEVAKESSSELKEALVLADLGGNYFQL